MRSTNTLAMLLILMFLFIDVGCGAHIEGKKLQDRLLRDGGLQSKSNVGCWSQASLLSASACDPLPKGQKDAEPAPFQTGSLRLSVRVLQPSVVANLAAREEPDLHTCGLIKVLQ